MTATKEELTRAFSDGMLPTGEDFSELIHSMVHIDTFDAHVRAFEAFKNAPEISLGVAPNQWDLKVDDSNHLVISPSSDVSLPGLADVNLWGYAGLSGRLGTALDKSAFQAATPSLDVATASVKNQTLGIVPGDGKPATIILPPGRACAFEFTAMGQVPPEKPDGTIKGVLRKLTGWVAFVPTVMHAVATSPGPGGAPSLTMTQSPDPDAAWGRLGRQVLVLLIALAVIAFLIELPLSGEIKTLVEELEAKAVAEGKEVAALFDSALAWVAAKLHLKGVALILEGKAWASYVVVALIVAWFLRLLIQAWRITRMSCELSWTKTSGGGLSAPPQYALTLRSSKGADQPDQARVFFSITRLWD